LATRVRAVATFGILAAMLREAAHGGGQGGQRGRG
jgi:hypothetical protein